MATYKTQMNKNEKLALTSAETNAEANINIVAYYANQQKQLNNYLSKSKN